MLCADQRWQLLADGSCCGGLVLFTLDVSEAERASHASLLSDIESARAARFHSPAHGARFQVAHGRLRQLLATQLGLAPEAVEFVAGPHGKPGLAETATGSRLRFNLSHSAGLGLVGWSWQGDIGVDVEAWRATRDEAALVHRYFSATEIAAWEALPPERRREAFYNLWTRKEAYVKGLGLGLSLPLDSFDVSHERAGGARLLRSSALVADGRSWSIAAPETGPDISVAVALEAGTCQIVRYAGSVE